MNRQLPLTPPPSISVKEYRTRISKVQEEMEALQLDALFITSEDNFLYLTGFRAPVWQNLTRPRYCIIPREGDPRLIIPAGQAIIAKRTAGWIKDVRTWLAPQPEDDGVSLVVEALKDCSGKFNRVGAELGPESRMTMPVGDFLKIQEALKPIDIVDGDWMLRKMRMIKSPGEIELIRYVCQLVSHAFEALPEKLHMGDTERIAAEKFQLDVLRNGGEKIVYFICTSGKNGYPCINLGPSDHVLENGDVLIIDTGVTYEGYYCDFDRDFSFGTPSDEVKRA
ncbi:MAG: aminopeptidase P family protein, partial [Alphaproteobacteria bacterium]|nr:aminopeptidase P family protein [Alphaproteobacteria bacterium]